VWLIESLLHGFRDATPEWRIQLFRILFGVACLAKFSVTFGHGGFARMAPGSLGRFQLCATHGQRRGQLLSDAYQPILVVRWIAATAVLCGFEPRIALVVVGLGLLFELTYAFRYNTIYLALLTCCLIAAGDLGRGFRFSAESSNNTWAQFLIVFITIDLYWNSAWQKIRSAHFHEGLLLAQFVHFISRVQHRLSYREFFYPKMMLTYLGSLEEASIGRWKLISRAVIVIELLLPLGLLCPPFYPYAVAVGIGMHLGFTVLMPRQLIGFSTATAGTYILFAHP
jgi:hypothetical protein